MKYYFEKIGKTDYSELCYPRSHYIELMKERDITEIEVYPAKIVYGEDYFWCHAISEPGMKGESCGKFCPDYKPRNGKNGRCVHHGHCYEPADKSIIIKLKP